MQRGRPVAITLPLALACLLPLAACGGDGDRTFAASELGAELLTTDAMGPGWTETQRTVFDTREPENPSIDPSLWCPDLGADAEQLTSLAGSSGADVELELAEPSSPDQPTYRLRQQAWSNTEADDYLRQFTEAVAACTGKVWEDAGTADEAAEYRLAPLPDPAVGDEAAAAMVTITLSAPADGGDAGDAGAAEPTLVIRQRMAAVRTGTIVMLLQEGDTLSPDGEPSTTDEEFAALVELAARPFVELDGGTG